MGSGLRLLRHKRQPRLSQCLHQQKSQRRAAPRARRDDPPILAREICAVPGFFQWFGKASELGLVDETLAEGGFFGAADDLAGASLDDADEVCGVGETIDGAGVEPDVAVFEGLDGELTAAEVFGIDGGDFELAAL